MKLKGLAVYRSAAAPRKKQVTVQLNKKLAVITAAASANGVAISVITPRLHAGAP
jgi:hypothetical protein